VSRVDPEILGFWAVGFEGGPCGLGRKFGWRLVGRLASGRSAAIQRRLDRAYGDSVTIVDPPGGPKVGATRGV